MLPKVWYHEFVNAKMLLGFVVSHTLLVYRIKQRYNFGKSVSFVQAFIISKMKKLLAFFKFILDYQLRDHSVLVFLPPLPIHFLSWQLIITAQHKDGNEWFQLFYGHHEWAVAFVSSILIWFRTYSFHLFSRWELFKYFMWQNMLFKGRVCQSSVIKNSVHIQSSMLPFFHFSFEARSFIILLQKTHYKVEYQHKIQNYTI